MTGGEYVFRFVYPPVDSDPDPRAVEIKQVVQVNGTEELRDFYKFQHPNTRMSFCVTNYFRKNFETQVWESAGHIDWSSNTVGTIYFGVERTSISEVRKEKKKTSKSRRFKAGGVEYKWKIADNGMDLICVSTQLANFGRNVAEWSEDDLTLRVSERVEGILDRIVVTCFLNMWMKARHRW